MFKFFYNILIIYFLIQHERSLSNKDEAKPFSLKTLIPIDICSGVTYLSLVYIHIPPLPPNLHPVY